MNITVLKASRIAAICILCFFVFGCSCDDYVKMVVLAGSHTAEESRQAIDKGSSDKVTLICPGEEVTICWDSNAKSVKIDPVLGTVGNIGMKTFAPTSSTTITASAPGSCASSVSVPVTVVDKDTPSTWDAGWDLNCSQITFDIDSQFVSPKILAKDITALFSPIISDASGGPPVACTTPPFRDGFQQQDIFGFKIDNPMITVPFSRHIPADGHWQFTLKALCPVDSSCNPAANLPFNLTLTCSP